MTKQMQKQIRGQAFQNRTLPAMRLMAFALSTCFLAQMGRMVQMEIGWAGFKNSLQKFFETGLGGDGMGGIGIAIAVIGIVAAIVSFVVHKFNPQSRMPGWITCLLIGMIGAIAMGGIAGPLKLVTKMRDILYSWIGI